MNAPQRTIGQFQVSAIGLGAMPLSFKDPLPSDEQSDATIHAALDAGITLIDTADIYAPSWDTMGHNEQRVAHALKSWSGDRDSVVVATKGGITRSQGNVWGRNGSPEYLRQAVEKSLRNLQVDVIDLYYWHRPDRHRLYADCVQVFADLKAEGKIKEIGISNANVEEIEIALEVLGEGGLAAVQNEFSLRFNHTSLSELQFCSDHDIAFLPWSPLGGSGGAKEVGGKYPAVQRIAQARGVSPQQVVLAWQLSLSDRVIPIPGASRPESILDSAQAMTLQLSDDEIESLHV